MHKSVAYHRVVEEMHSTESFDPRGGGYSTPPQRVQITYPFGTEDEARAVTSEEIRLIGVFRVTTITEVL